MSTQSKFDNYFKDYYRPLCAFAYSFIGDVEVVEDLVQEVFIKYWEKVESLEHDVAVKSYLYTSARNTCLNYLKHEQMVKKHEYQIRCELENNEVFEGQVIEEEVFRSLYKEIEELPSASKKVMLLALKGLKNREIAEALNVSENTVKTQKKIAYGKLKGRVNPTLMLLFASF